MAGIVSFSVTILLGVYAFLENQIKEHYESIIKAQQQAMQNLSTTHSKFEDHQRKSLTDTSKGIKQEKYIDYSEVSKTDT